MGERRYVCKFTPDLAKLGTKYCSNVCAIFAKIDRSDPMQVAKVFMGEGAGLIYSVDAAEKVTRDVSREAEEQLDTINRLRT